MIKIIIAYNLLINDRTVSKLTPSNARNSVYLNLLHDSRDYYPIPHFANKDYEILE